MKRESGSGIGEDINFKTLERDNTTRSVGEILQDITINWKPQCDLPPMVWNWVTSPPGQGECGSLPHQKRGCAPCNKVTFAAAWPILSSREALTLGRPRCCSSFSLHTGEWSRGMGKAWQAVFVGNWAETGEGPSSLVSPNPQCRRRNLSNSLRANIWYLEAKNWTQKKMRKILSCLSACKKYFGVWV